MNILEVAEIKEKISSIDLSCELALRGQLKIPAILGRDVKVLPIKELPKKPGLSTTLGLGRLLHDLANIELQAMELGLRTLIEFPEAPEIFREQLLDIVIDEARHLSLCLEQMETLKQAWGAWPVHLGLWLSVSAEDSLLDRVLIVHRYLEGAGLDAGETILRKLSGVDERGVRGVVKTIAEEEIGHVRFGSDWYKQLCQKQKLDPAQDFEQRLDKLFHRIPRRLEKIEKTIRKKAGFTEDELSVLEKFQGRWLAPEKIHKHPLA